MKAVGCSKTMLRIYQTTRHPKLAICATSERETSLLQLWPALLKTLLWFSVVKQLVSRHRSGGGQKPASHLRPRSGTRKTAAQRVIEPSELVSPHNSNCSPLTYSSAALSWAAGALLWPTSTSKLNCVYHMAIRRQGAAEECHDILSAVARYVHGRSM
jgi:hypothetical protein